MIEIAAFALLTGFVTLAVIGHVSLFSAWLGRS
jgi:hypothetical protein